MLKRVGLIGFLWLFWLAPLALARAQGADEIAFLRYDVEIDVTADGRFTVREIQELSFDGAFSEGFGEIPLDFVTNIYNIQLFGGPDRNSLVPYAEAFSGPNTFTLQRQSNLIVVEWRYPETKPGDRLTFVLQYEVEGGLWIYPDYDVLEWRAVPADRSGLAVPASRVTVNLPFAPDPAALGATAFGPAYTAEILPLAAGQQVVFEATEPLPDGAAFQVLVDFPHGLVTAVPQPWQIAADQAELSYRLERVDVELELTADGLLRVVEEQRVAVDAGNMVEGYRTFPWLYLEGLDELTVSEGEIPFVYQSDAGALQCEYCFTLRVADRPASWARFDARRDEIVIDAERAGSADVVWRFPALVQGEATTFRLEYVAQGAVSVNEESQQLYWTVLPNYPVPVEAASVRLRLPGGLGLEDIRVEGATGTLLEDGRILFTLAAPAPAWSLTITLPPGATTAVKPQWQLQLETVTETAVATRERVARRQLALQGGGLLAGVLAALGGVTAWYLRGSRKVREMLGKYRTEPPSDLAPGLVAYLVEKEATARGALASLLHLAALGLVRAQVVGETLLLERVYEEPLKPRQRLTTPTGDVVRAPDHVVRLFNGLRAVLPQGSAVPLDQILPAFHGLLPALYAAMGEEMVNYFHGGGRRRAGCLSSNVVPFIGFLIFAGMALLLSSGIAEVGVTMAVLCAFGLFFFIVFLQALRGVFKSGLTDAGTQEANRWLGFKAYLQDIQKFGDLPEAQEILDRYFAYAVALGVEERFLQQVRALGGVTPAWLGGGELPDGSPWRSRPLTGRPWYRRPWYQRGAWSARPARPVTAAPRPVKPESAEDQRPALQRVSDALTGSLSNANTSLTRTLNTAVSGSQEPVGVRIKAAGQEVQMNWSADTPVDQMLGDIMRKSQTIRPPRPSASRSSGSGGYRGGSGGGRPSGGRRSSSRSSGSRRSGGGGRRGFR
jgi:uncharacterized membrane protein YgcG